VDHWSCGCGFHPACWSGVRAVAFYKRLRPWIIGSVTATLLMVAGYSWEMSRYNSGMQDDELVTRWLQRAEIMQQQASINDKKKRTRNIFVNTKAVKRAAIKKKTKQKKKLVRKKPSPKPVVDMASRLRCLAVARRGQQWTAYMTLDEQVHMVKPGDVINKQVRILEIGETGVRVEDIKAGRRSLVPVLGV